MTNYFYYRTLFSALVFLCLAASAQDSSKQFVYRKWNNQNGLPQNTVNSLVFDSEGYLWIATEEGVVRFDGHEFSIFNEFNTPEILSSVFYDLASSRNGIWAANRNSVLKISSRGLRSYDLRARLQGEWINCVEEDVRGRLWIGTSSGKIFILANDSLKIVSQFSAEASGPIEELLLYAGQIVAGTARGLFYFKDTDSFQEAPEFAGKHITALATGSREALWIGTANNGLFRNDGDTLIQYGVAEGFRDAYINSLAVASDGKIWIGTRSSGYRVLENGKIKMPPQNDFTHDGIKAILPTSEDQTWLGTTSSGLVQIKPALIRKLSPENRLVNQIILPIYEHPSGEVWIGTAGRGVTRMLNGRSELFTTSNGLSGDLILSVNGTADFIYIGTSHGVDRYNRKSKRIDRRFTVADGLTSNSIVAIFPDSRNRIWITTRTGGIHVMENEQSGIIRKVNKIPSLSTLSFISAMEDRQGNIWFGSRGAGALRISRDGDWKQYNSTTGFPAEIVFDIYEDGEGNIWMATDKGLVGGKERFKTFDKNAGLLFNEIYRILKDDDDYVWLSGNLGLQRIPFNELREALMTDKKTQLPVRLFHTADGMANAEANGGFMPAGWKMQDGSLWFPTVEGIAIADPKYIVNDGVPVNIRLQSIRFGEHSFTPGKEVSIPPGVYNLEISYTSIDYSKAADIRYQYRLRGWSNEWIDARDRRTAYFTSLPPGDYTFEVRALQYGQSSRAAVWPFTVRPHFYQTNWFRATMIVAGVLLLALIIFAIRRKQHRKLGQHKRIIKAQLTGQEKERQVIGAELHDNINQRLATAKLYLDYARSNEEMRLPMIEKSEKVVQDVITDIRGLCRSLIPPTLKDIGLTDSLRELLDSYRSIRKFEFHFESDAPLDLLEEDLQFSLFRIIQEQLNNIVRHASARHVWVRFRLEGSRIELKIKDDGKGFNARRTKGGRGFINMRNRLELFDGNLQIISFPGKGCTLLIQVPLRLSESVEVHGRV